MAQRRWGRERKRAMSVAEHRCVIQGRGWDCSAKPGRLGRPKTGGCGWLVIPQDYSGRWLTPICRGTKSAALKAARLDVSRTVTDYGAGVRVFHSAKKSCAIPNRAYKHPKGTKARCIKRKGKR